MDRKKEMDRGGGARKGQTKRTEALAAITEEAMKAIMEISAYACCQFASAVAMVQKREEAKAQNSSTTEEALSQRLTRDYLQAVEQVSLDGYGEIARSLERGDSHDGALSGVSDPDDQLEKLETGGEVN